MSRRRLLLVAGLIAGVMGALILYLAVFRHDPGDPLLNAFVFGRPPVPVVFTSRSEPTSFEAAAPDGEEFKYPGKRLWTAREGRLRVLHPHGTVRELTWGNTLPEGGTLIDVMSPSITLDGKRVLFSGRKGGDDHGHFRLYEVNIDGSGLKQLTGGQDDEGATEVPPMRFRADGSVITDSERRRTDYDDVDPAEVRADPREILFASSRTPDLGRDHARRSTTLWVLRGDGSKTQATANRNNDRWPFVMSSGYAAFSLWSRNREVISEDQTTVEPYRPLERHATLPTDYWLGAFVRISTSGHFGMLVKTPVPVWRPRPLFNGRITFMTTLRDAGPGQPELTVGQAEPGLISNAPSSAVGALPRQKNIALRRGPVSDASGQPLWLATPSPCPPDEVLLSAAPLDAGRAIPEPGRFGIYLASANWPEQDFPAQAEAIGLRLLFDDPELVDAEPVAVYSRRVNLPPKGRPEPASPEKVVKLFGDRLYSGPTGDVLATGLHSAMMNDLPGQMTDTGESPVFGPPPAGSIHHVKVFASRRDQFNDTEKSRVPGKWELLLELPAKDAVNGALPTDCPTVLAGFGADGKVVRWSTGAKDSTGRRGEFYAIAGDHYSLTSPGGKHFCVGCHPGHSGLPRAQHQHSEQRSE